MSFTRQSMIFRKSNHVKMVLSIVGVGVVVVRSVEKRPPIQKKTARSIVVGIQYLGIQSVSNKITISIEFFKIISSIRVRGPIAKGIIMQRRDYGKSERYRSQTKRFNLIEQYSPKFSLIRHSDNFDNFNKSFIGDKFRNKSFSNETIHQNKWNSRTIPSFQNESLSNEWITDPLLGIDYNEQIISFEFHETRRRIDFTYITFTKILIRVIVNFCWKKIAN